MAIRRELRRFYGASWRRYRAALIASHGAFCSVCGRACPRYLNLAHLTHDPRSSDVARMCPACHARHDWRHALAIRRRNRAARYGQGWLWPEVAEAPYAAWMRPRGRPAGRREDRQGGLFS